MAGRNAESFVATVREHEKSLRALAYRLVGNKVDDVLQEAYLRAYRGLDGFQKRSTMRTWLHRIVYTTCVDELRKPQLIQFPVDGADDVADGHSSPDTQVAASIDLANAMDGLPEPQRAAVWLVDGAGFTYKETADILEAPEGSVATWVSRGRSVLRASLRGEVDA